MTIIQSKFVSALFCLCLIGFGATVDPVCMNQGLNTDILCTSWIINSVNTSMYFDNALVSVQNAALVTLGNTKYMKVDASGIPQYDHIMTSADITWLNKRPKASTDFPTGATTAVVNETIAFGESIGYSGIGCSLDYWPPGPECPTSNYKVANFPVTVVPSDVDCYTSLGNLGFWVNGVSVYNWWDGTSYNMKNVWHTMAAWAEFYDLDLCSGHAASGDYHHHTYPNCLAELLEDKGDAKSPIYGFAADGVPILGPWVQEGVLAKSCWENRDYNNPNSTTGCGTAYKRSCLLVDQYDISKGTIAASSNGPDTNANVTTQSGNSIMSKSGFYFEDHYYAPSCTGQGDEYLDQFNGRFDEKYGYVYHVSIDDLDRPEFVTSTFPHFIGPTFYGTLDQNTLVQCSTTQFNNDRNGGGGRPPVR